LLFALNSIPFDNFAPLPKGGGAFLFVREQSYAIGGCNSPIHTEGPMQVEVGPARRPGRADTIYDRPLKKDDLQVEPDGGIALTIDASGIRDGRSQYRYRISFTAAEAGKLVSVIASTSGN
jgi:hypothetical protein